MADGLDGVVAAETALSMVDGAAGRLVIRGRDVEALAEGVSAEAMAELLIDGLLPGLPRGPALVRALGEARAEIFASLDADLLACAEPMDALRAHVARIPDGDDAATALRLLAAPAVVAPAVMRARAGAAPLPPDARAGQAADMLAMLGEARDARRAAALDAYLAVVSDHGFNASTFAARVVASTRAGLVSSALAGLSALKRPLHGGAPGPVIAMLDEIGAPERAEAWLEAALDRGERLMGFGHRIYRVRDPRADALKRVVRGLAREGGGARLVFAERVEAAALEILKRRKPDRPLDVNVEFYTALLLESLGFGAEVFTCVFAAGRMAGWIAHAREQQASGRLIRPQSRYIGPTPELAA